MKYHVLRRAGALVLALAMALSLSVAPAWAVDPGDLSIEGPTEIEQGGKITLSAKWGDGVTKPNDPIMYTWSCDPTATDLNFSTAGESIEIEADAAATPRDVEFKLVASWNEGGTPEQLEAVHKVTIKAATAPDPGPVEVTGVTLNKTELALTTGGSETLTATVEPSNATDRTVRWSCAPATVATVDNTGRVTAVGAGTATVTATAGGRSASCTVTVEAGSATGISFTNPSTIVRGAEDANPWELSVSLTPTGSIMPEGDVIKWNATPKNTTDPEAVPPTGWEEETGTTVRLTDRDPGDYTITAEYHGVTATRDVTVSGITLSRDELTMLVGDSRTVAIDKMYGYAASGSIADVVWTSSDPSTVTVLNGELIAWKLGSAVITASKTVNKSIYTAECKVTVGEDESVIAGPYSATTGTPLILSTTHAELNQISLKKTETEDASGNKIEGSPLNYITNVMVPTDQGTLYYNYNSDANTGAGVGITDRFALNPTGSIQRLDKLYFVPRQGFSGTAEITFNGWAVNGTGFSGVIRVNVTGVDHVSYRTNAGQPAYFLGGDFNAFCRSKMGRDLSYVTFNLPAASQGTLYYNYTGTGQTADRVSTSTEYSRSGRYMIDDVCFVPNDAFVGEARISFRGVDTAGQAFNGEVVIYVTPAGAEEETANVYISTQRGQPAVLQASLFNDACQATIRDTLSYVYFKLPAYNEGTLYYNYRSAASYDSRVSTTTRYYYSGVPGINGVTFVPASNTTGRVAIPYTGYGTGGTSFTGTLYISMDDTERATVRYFIPKNGAISFDANDFNNAALLQIGASAEYVEFQVPDEIRLGGLYYDYRSSTVNNSVYSNFAYYRTPKETYQGRLDLISFRAGASAGTVTIPYTAYAAADSATGDRESFSGTVVIQVGSPTPADINLTCNTSGQAWLSGYTLGGVCSPVMDKNLSYIEITGLPPAEQGKVYNGYTGFKTGTEVKPGDRFYWLGAPNIDLLSFVPRAGFTGQAEFTYVGFSSDGQEQVSGRILVNVTRATGSRYFNDMANHVWAVDSVDYLYQNKAINGVGGGRFNPTGYISKGDFTLMLVRAFGFTANGSVSYYDVPAGSYYADAIRVASLVGIASGASGYYHPNSALTRQDAIVMIYNALVADGRTMTNGLAADLSGYRDHLQISNYARAAVGSLVQMGVVQGDGNGYLRPLGLLNRAETAMLLHTIMTM